MLCWWTLSWGGVLIAEHLSELGRVCRGTDCMDGQMQQLCDLLGVIHTEGGWRQWNSVPWGSWQSGC